jgi:tRNA dimethylallyltransferase
LNRKTVIIVTGPTASGKTSLAIDIALFFKTEIVSADSRQCFRELNIGVAKPDGQQLASVKHHFINSHSIYDEVNAAVFAEFAHHALNEIFRNHDVAVVAGGTGLYIKALTEGLDDIPEIPAQIRNEIRTAYNQHGIEWLKMQVSEQDPLYYSTGETDNPQRMLRALEVKLATGKSIRKFQGGGSTGSKYNFIKYAIELPRAQLYAMINMRVDHMMQQGLEAEAGSLLPNRHLNALQTVGYSELFDYFDGKISLPEAIDKIKQNTRNYAKRQLTWFRKDKEIRWIKDFAGIRDELRTLLQTS